ncbi:MAG TPA: hypothetical protein VF598_14850, partial [Hymenobacter sp.]
MNQPRHSISRPSAATPRRLFPLVLLVLLLAGLAFYGRYWRQLRRYVRRTYATWTSGRLTGREKTPLLAGYSVHGIDVSAYQG